MNAAYPLGRQRNEERKQYETEERERKWEEPISEEERKQQLVNLK